MSDQTDQEPVGDHDHGEEDDVEQVLDGVEFEELTGGHTAKGVEDEEGQIFIREEDHIGGMVEDKDGGQGIEAHIDRNGVEHAGEASQHSHWRHGKIGGDTKKQHQKQRAHCADIGKERGENAADIGGDADRHADGTDRHTGRKEKDGAQRHIAHIFLSADIHAGQIEDHTADDKGKHSVQMMERIGEYPDQNE